MREISIIMPAYNESKHIRKNAHEVLDVLRYCGFEKFEVIVVDDGSTDKTFESLLYDNDIVTIRIKENLGKGNAIREGCMYAMNNVVCFLDSDLDIAPHHIVSMYNNLIESGVSVVVGSKLHPKSLVYGSFLRKCISKGYYILIKLLFRLPYRDTQTGIKMFRQSVLNEIIPITRSRRFAFDLELMNNIYKKGFKVMECPVVVNSHRPTRIHIGNVWNVFVETLVIWWRSRG